MDTFFEQIVKKKKTALELGGIVATIIVALVLVAVLWVLSVPLLTPLLTVGILYGAWWLLTGLNVEYEYCVTNGDIDIDLIIAKRKRKRIVSVVGRKVECLLPYNAATVDEKAYQRVVVAASSKKAEGLWYFTYHSKKSGHTLVLFEPEERVLCAFADGLTSLAKIETRRALQERGIAL